MVKADGLASGKGTVVAENEAEALDAVASIMSEKKFGSAGARIVMEEFLRGDEVSFLVFSDGSRVVPMISVQDHKRALRRRRRARTPAGWARSRPRPT